MLFRELLLLDEDVKRFSSCELEVDVVAADIANRLDVDGLSVHTLITLCKYTVAQKS